MIDTTLVTILLAAGGLTLNVAVVIVGGVWVVAQVKGESGKLRAMLDAARESLDHLRAWLQDVEERHRETQKRITAIEVKCAAEHGREL